MPPSEQIVAFIGCGNMGGAILHGVLDAAFSSENSSAKQLRLVSKFVACTKTAKSAERLSASFSPEQKAFVKVVSSDTVPVQIMKDADIVVLGFKPFMAADVLQAPGVQEALGGKLVISLLAGQTPQDLAKLISDDPRELFETQMQNLRGSYSVPFIVKAIPNMGAQFRQSVTVIEMPESPLPSYMTEVVEWMFKQVGEIKYLPQSQMDLGSVLVGAALAAMTVPIEGILDGCVVEGLKRSDAMEMMIGGLKGLTAALEAGIHPAVLRESISSPRGCTI